MEHKGRMWTPVSIAVLSVCLAAGFAFIGWCGDTAVKVFSTHFTNIEQKQDTMFRALANIKDKEESDTKCLAKGLYGISNGKVDC